MSLCTLSGEEVLGLTTAALSWHSGSDACDMLGRQLPLENSAGAPLELVGECGCSPCCRG